MISTTMQVIEIYSKSPRETARERRLKAQLIDTFQTSIDFLSTSRLFYLDLDLTHEELKHMASQALCQGTHDGWCIGNEKGVHKDCWKVRIRFKSGVTDTLGMTAQETMGDCLGRSLGEQQRVYSAQLFYFQGNLTKEILKTMAQEFLANSLIEEVDVFPPEEFLSSLTHESSDLKKQEVERISISSMSDEELLSLNKERQLVLNLPELQAIRKYFTLSSTKESRKEKDLSLDASDAELEVFAQTWSEHCKHKIFGARITYREGEEAREVNSLFRTHIQGVTKLVEKKCPWLLSVFVDNAGVIELNDRYSLAFKVETHNSPSALDPYGGALTGILGVNRDTTGTGLGTRLLCNTNVFCFAPPQHKGTLPPRLMHPRRILEGVRKGVEDGGNKSGVPTVNGSLVFDERYLGKPLVYCGTVGIQPRIIQNRPGHDRKICVGDAIILAGGLTGKDGIHGATFSSEALHEESPTSAVQIGDPFTQKKLNEFLLEARDLGYYRSLTDNGAGGLSSSVGELAELSGGAQLHLDQVTLKYAGLKPWEILLSESQERMTLAVPPQFKEPLFALAQKHGVHVDEVGEFTDSGFFHVLYEEETVVYLDLDFLHNGVPQLQLEAEWKAPSCPSLTREEVSLGESRNLLEDLKALLARPNVCSKEWVVRQYDHEVQASTIVKPLVGPQQDGPSNAGVILPLECQEEGCWEGFAVGHGLCPRVSDWDTYSMASFALDEAMRNIVAVGADPDHTALLDNFCWPDPIHDAKTNPDGSYKLAQLVRACEALYDVASIYGTPFISGKDSMKNDYRIGDTKISVPPTLLISALGKVHDVRDAVTMDLKAAGHGIYILGETDAGLAGSEWMAYAGLSRGGGLSQLDPQTSLSVYRTLHRCIRGGLVASCHDCSDGGLAVALAETAFSGLLGLEISLDSLPCRGEVGLLSRLFAETPGRLVCSVAPQHEEVFQKAFGHLPCECIGRVSSHSKVSIDWQGKRVLEGTCEALKKAWQSPVLQGGDS